MLDYIKIIAICLFAQQLAAQYETVSYDYERNFFNQGQELPAESYMMLQGEVPTEIQLIKVEINKARRWKKDPLYSTLWTRSFTNQGETYEIPLNYKLRSSEQYDFVIRFYKNATSKEKKALNDNLLLNVRNYVKTIIDVGGKGVEMDKPVNSVMSDLGDIVKQTSKYFTSRIAYDFVGFSEIIRGKLKQVRSGKYEEVTELSREEQKEQMVESINELNRLLESEVKQHFGGEVLILSDVHRVSEYRVEKTRNHLALNVGYGSVFLSGDFEDLDYDTGLYLGFSVPLGNSSFAPRIIGNSSLSVGVFTSNLHTADGTVVTGPFIGRPIYGALGYNAFQFLRLNAGVSVIELEETINGQVSSRVDFQPFFGVSAEINLWLGINR